MYRSVASVPGLIHATYMKRDSLAQSLHIEFDTNQHTRYTTTKTIDTMDSRQVLLYMPVITIWHSYANLAPPLEQVGAKLGI